MRERGEVDKQQVPILDSEVTDQMFAPPKQAAMVRSTCVDIF